MILAVLLLKIDISSFIVSCFVFSVSGGIFITFMSVKSNTITVYAGFRSHSHRDSLENYQEYHRQIQANSRNTQEILHSFPHLSLNYPKTAHQVHTDCCQ